MYCVKGGFTTETLHRLAAHLWYNDAQDGKAVIDPQGRTERERPGWAGALFSLLQAPAKGALTHHPQAGGGTACGSRALGQDPEGWTIRPPNPLQDKGHVVDLNRGRLYQVTRRSSTRSSFTFLPVRTNSRRHRRLGHRTKFCPMLWGLGGYRPPTSCTGYIPVHCLPLLLGPINKG